MRLFTEVTPVTLAVQEPKLIPVREAVAVPGASGLVRARAVNGETPQVTPVAPVVAE